MAVDCFGMFVDDLTREERREFFVCSPGDDERETDLVRCLRCLQPLRKFGAHWAHNTHSCRVLSSALLHDDDTHTHTVSKEEGGEGGDFQNGRQRVAGGN